MTLDSSLDTLPDEPRSPAERLRAAFEMYEEGVAMQRLTLQRRFPDLNPNEIEARLERWLAREDEAP